MTYIPQSYAEMDIEKKKMFKKMQWQYYENWRLELNHKIQIQLIKMWKLKSEMK